MRERRCSKHQPGGEGWVSNLILNIMPTEGLYNRLRKIGKRKMETGKKIIYRKEGETYTVLSLNVRPLLLCLLQLTLQHVEIMLRVLVVLLRSQWRGLGDMGSSSGNGTRLGVRSWGVCRFWVNAFADCRGGLERAGEL